MKGVNYCWFSYGDDERMLDVGLTVMKNKFPEGNFFVFEQGEKPLCDDIKRMHGDRVRFQKTWWNRRLNLNGWEAVRGILGAFLESVMYSPANWVCKLDSDTFLLNNHFLLPALEDKKNKAVSFAAGDWGNLCGGCYFLRANTLINLYKFSRNKCDYLVDFIGAYGEDWTISHIFDIEYGKKEHMELLENSNIGFENPFHSWQFGASIPEIARQHDILCFGEKSLDMENHMDYRHIAMFNIAQAEGIDASEFTWNPAPPSPFKGH